MIDVHVHPVQVAELHAADPTLDRAVRDVFGLGMPPQPLETLLLHLDAGGIDQAVMLPIDCTTAHGCTVVSNEQAAWLAGQSSRLIGFASVDPSLPDAPAALEHAVRGLGLRGLSSTPPSSSSGSTTRPGPSRSTPRRRRSTSPSSSTPA